MKKIFAVLMVLIMILALCACSRKTDSQRSHPVMADGYDYNSSAVSAGILGGFAANGAPKAAYEEYSLDAEVEMFNAQESARSEARAGVNAEENDTGDDINPEKIIYSADTTVETTEFDETLKALENMVAEFGGWTESSSVNGVQYNAIAKGARTNRSASYTIRIPNSKFETVMEKLPSLGNIPYSHTYTENVTSQYYDTQARLTTYEAQEKRLLELLDEAQDVSDVIEIENELTEIRYRIESLQTTLRGWDRRVNWSTLYLTVNEVSEYTPQAARSYGSRLLDSLEEGIDVLGDLFLDFVEALPVLILLLALLIVVILSVKRTVKFGWRRRDKKQMIGQPTSSADEK